MIEQPILAPIPEQRHYRLLKPYPFKDQFGRQWLIELPFTYDGASVPTITGLFWVATYSKFDPHVMRAALVHDYFCTIRVQEMTHRPAAELFYSMLIEDGVPSWKASAMKMGVLSPFGPKW